MRVLICGSRTWVDRVIVNAVLDGLHAEVTSWNGTLFIIEGGAKGADRIAQDWAKGTGVDLWTCPAEWDTYGKRAGYLRNTRMLVEGKPDLIVAFGHGRGTDMMVELAKKAKVPTYRVVRES